MTNLMDGITGGTRSTKLDKLIATDTAYMRPATGTWPEVHIIRVHRLIRSGTQDKTNPCIGLPVRYSIGYAGLIGKRTVNCIRNDAVGPPLGGQDHHTCFYLPAYLGAAKLCVSLDLLDSTQDDIAFKDRVTIDFTVLDLFRVKSLSIDKRSTQLIRLILLTKLTTAFLSTLLLTFFGHNLTPSDYLLNSIINARHYHPQEINSDRETFVRPLT